MPKISFVVCNVGLVSETKESKKWMVVECLVLICIEISSKIRQKSTKNSLRCNKIFMLVGALLTCRKLIWANDLTNSMLLTISNKPNEVIRNQEPSEKRNKNLLLIINLCQQMNTLDFKYKNLKQNIYLNPQ
ncbi:hypothetical protein BpHYR1_033684 [Brachionus plicatilis]|uniref:Uncharacterized protein n=1 Tax=Brachionus plicatilis TaxID=10195 RepID=A0A3M7Q7T1_BRAPC|nr:hypothetical protein BpHYR1_033684 [Brachionus plicatilis]